MRFMQLSVNCLDPTAVWRVGPAPKGEGLPENAETLLLANAPLRVRTREAPHEMFFSANQVIEIVENERVERREFRVHTLGYIYALTLDERMDEPLVEWHYHPYAGRDDTHVHFMKRGNHPLTKVHVPTGRTSFESIIRSIITDFGVENPHDGWEETLDDCERRFNKHKRW